jgi:hypothetical protein
MSGITLAYNELKQLSIPDYAGAQTSIPVKVIFGGVEKEDRIPHFDHALVMNKTAFIPALAADPVIFDMRNYANFDLGMGRVKTRYVTDYNFAVLRAALQKRWMDSSPNTLRDFSILPVTLYSSLISEVVKRRLALDAGAQARVAVMAAYYYLCQFTNSDTVPEADLHKFADIIKRATYQDAGRVYEIIEDLPVIKSISEFCDITKEKAGAIQLKDQLNPVLLFTLVKNTWFGAAAERIICAGLEHPPTWIAVATSSLMEFGYQKSQIGILAQRYKKTDTATNMINSLMGLFGGRDDFKTMFETDNF